MKKNIKGIGIFLLVLVVLITLFGKGKQYEVADNNSSKTVSRLELLDNNDPNIKEFNYATADYLGQTFTLYAMTNVADYYNYGFADEMKYYSVKVWDNSVDGEYEGAYAYIDKTNPEKKAKELFEMVLEEPVLLKLKLSIPVEKYKEDSNSFFEIEEWELID